MINPKKSAMKNLLYVILMVTAWISNIQSQSVIFTGPYNVNEPSLAFPSDFKTGDIDNDGKPDIVITSKYNNSVFWFKNIDAANNVFSKPKPISLFDTPSSGHLELADIDKDGDLDIVVGGDRDYTLCWFKNNGAGEFEKIEIDNTTDGITSIVAADIDNDNDIDIIAGYWEGHKISYFENTDGKGTFSDEKTIASGLEPVAQISFVDMNGDNRKDIVALLHHKNKIIYLENNGDTPNFTVSHTLYDHLDSPTAFQVDDVDKDGDMDIVIADNSNVILLKNNNGAYSQSQEIHDNNQFINDIVFFDVDNDNDKDIILGNSEGKKILYFENTDGKGTFSDAKTIISDIAGCYYIEISDLDKNGKPELIAGSVYDNKLIAAESKGDGTFKTPVYIYKSLLKKPEILIPGDFNNDGLIDIVSANNLSLFTNVNKGASFTSKIINEKTKYRLGVKGDFDNDGRLDVIMQEFKYPHFSLVAYKNRQGNFEEEKLQINFLPVIYDMQTIDMDKDGKQDIVYVTDEGHLGILKNKGGWKFEPVEIVKRNFPADFYMTVNDFDGDGDYDIVLAVYYDNKIYYFENDNGNFKEVGSNISFSFTYPYAIASGDIDSDGDLDLIYSSNSNPGLFISENDGSGKFSDPVKISKDSWYVYPQRIIVEDVDKDGDLDVFVLTTTYSEIYFFENKDGKGNFLPAVEINDILKEPVQFAFADIDDDNLKDLLVLYKKQSLIRWHKALKSPVFTLQPQDTIKVCGETVVELKVDYDKADSIRWQYKPKYLSAFYDIYDNYNYAGAVTKTLKLKTAEVYDGFQYRCKLYYKGFEFYSSPATLLVTPKIHPDPGQNRDVCTGEVSLSTSTEGDSYKWKVIQGGAHIVNPNSPSTVAKNLSKGINIFRLIISKGECKDSAQLVITLRDSVVITTQPGDLRLQKGSQARFKVEAKGDINSYQWYFNGNKLYDGNNIVGSQTAELIINKVNESHKGNYHCVVEGYCNEARSHTVVLDVITATENPGIENPVLYPNPADNSVYIASGDFGIERIRVYDLYGRILIDMKYAKNTLDVSGLLPGIYTVELEGKSRNFRLKLMIKR